MDYYCVHIVDQPEYDTLSVALDEYYPEGDPVDIWALSTCRPYRDPRPLPFHVYEPGLACDYHEDGFGNIVVSERLREIVDEIARLDVQFVPVSFPAPGLWTGVNVLAKEGDVYDHTRSYIKYYPQDHPKAGRPDSIYQLVLDKSKLGRHHIFRLEDWSGPIIISEVVRSRCDQVGITNMDLQRVT